MNHQNIFLLAFIFDIYFDFGEERNNKLLESKIKQKQFNDNIKKIVSLKNLKFPKIN